MPDYRNNEEVRMKKRQMDEQALLSNTAMYISSMNFYLNKYSEAFAMKYLYLEINKIKVKSCLLCLTN
jgi:hypothetical protein